MKTRLWLVLVAAALLMAAVAEAHAEDEIERMRLRFAERGGQLVINELGLGPLLFDEAAYRKLKENPLATVVMVRLYVFRTGMEEPVAYSLLSMRIVYDLWLEQYEVRIDSSGGRDTGHVARLDQAYKRITELQDLVVADLDDIAIGPHHYLALVAELNPVSDEALAEMRRWLTRPAGSSSLQRETSFFGSFVSIFVNAKLPAADRVVRARSQPFYRVAR